MFLFLPFGRRFERNCINLEFFKRRTLFRGKYFERDY